MYTQTKGPLRLFPIKYETQVHHNQCSPIWKPGQLDQGKARRWRDKAATRSVCTQAVKLCIACCRNLTSKTESPCKFAGYCPRLCPIRPVSSHLVLCFSAVRETFPAPSSMMPLVKSGASVACGTSDCWPFLRPRVDHCLLLSPCHVANL